MLCECDLIHVLWQQLYEGCGLYCDEGCGLYCDEGCGLYCDEGCGLYCDEGRGLYCDEGCHLCILFKTYQIQPFNYLTSVVAGK